MPIAIIIILICIIGVIIYIRISHDNKLMSRKQSCLLNIEVGDKARLIIPDSKICFGKISKVADKNGYYTIKYKVKKDFMHPPTL